MRKISWTALAFTLSFVHSTPPTEARVAAIMQPLKGGLYCPLMCRKLSCASEDVAAMCQSLCKHKKIQKCLQASKDSGHEQKGMQHILGLVSKASKIGQKLAYKMTKRMKKMKGPEARTLASQIQQKYASTAGGSSGKHKKRKR